MRKEDSENNRIKEEADDIRARFPNPETDERLQTPSVTDLPPVPEVNFTRPDTKTARGYKTASKRTMANGTQVPSSGQSQDKDGEYRNMGIASTIGFSLVGSILTGTLLGWLADRYILHSGTTPWGLILGFFAGVLSGFISLIRVTNQLNK